MSHWPVLLALGLISVLLSFSATHGGRRRRWFWRRSQPWHSGSPAADIVNSTSEEVLTDALRFPLSGCRLGQSVCLQCLEVDHCVLHRLRELGLTPGVELSVVQDSGGPLLVAVRGSRVALGRDLADNLYVIPVERIPVRPVDSSEEQLS